MKYDPNFPACCAIFTRPTMKDKWGIPIRQCCRYCGKISEKRDGMWVVIDQIKMFNLEAVR